MEVDRTYRLVLLGKANVGRSSLFTQLMHGCMSDYFDPTIEGCYRKAFRVDDEPCYLDILCRSLPVLDEELTNNGHNNSLLMADGFMLVYSIASEAAFKEIPAHHDAIMKARGTERVPLVLVGNMCDLEHMRAVATEDGAELAKSFGCPFLEASAKERINLEEVFFTLVRAIRKTTAEQDDLQSRHRRAGVSCPEASVKRLN